MVESDIYKAVRNFKDVLDSKGVSDSGREYFIYRISSAHVNDTRLSEALAEMFNLLEVYEDE